MVRQINSPRSLEACLRVGLDPAELAPKPFKAFQSSDLTPQMVQIKFDQFERKRKDKIAAVQAERKAVIEYAEKKRQKAIAAAAAAAAAAGLDAAAAAAAVAAGEAEISQALLIVSFRNSCPNFSMHYTKFLQKFFEIHITRRIYIYFRNKNVWRHCVGGKKKKYQK